MVDSDGAGPVQSLAGRAFGRYWIIDRLGSGGMGVVYRARDPQLDREIAIKVLPANAALEPTARARLIREARTASKLNHPNICTVHEVGEADGQTYIVMELVEGRTLSSRLNAGAMAPALIVRYATQLADGLAIAHARGIVHRDLKSSNVMVTPDDRVKILDFGLARQIDADWSGTLATEAGATITEPGVVTGTLAYMSPEQLSGLPADARSDIWALGVMMYEMAAGQLPFSGVTKYETTASILRGALPALSKRIPAAIGGVIAKCLEKDPEQRFQQASDIPAALQPGPDVGAPGPPPAVRSSRRWMLATIVAATCVLAAAAALQVDTIRERTGALFSPNIVAFGERDWLLVANFENHTGDPGFDKPLDTAFAVAMGQSNYVNVVPSSRIEGAKRRMKIASADRLDRSTARQIAQRENIRLVLVPAIAEVGGVYQLSGSLEDPATGALVRSAVVRAPRKQDVLNGVDELVQRIRSDLGEAQRSVAAHRKPLAGVTTSSLEALKVYSTAVEAHRAARIDEAAALYEEALRLDPSFNSAKANLGILNFELRDREKGKALLAQAIEAVESLTDYERYTVLAFHAAAVENNPKKAADYYGALLAIYPDRGNVYNNLGRAYMRLRSWNEAVAALKRALEIDPDTMLTYSSLNEIYLYQLGDLDAAIALCRRQLAFNDQSALAYDNLGWAMLGKGELAQARDSFQKALAIDPRSTLDLYRLGHTLRLEGRYAEARETFLRIPTTDPAERSAYYDAGVAARMMGDERAAAVDFQKFRQLVERRVKENPRSAADHLDLAMAAVRLGDRARAASSAARATALDPGLHFEMAAFLAQNGQSADALRHLQLAIDNGYRDFIWMKIHEDLEPLAAEPRFQELVTGGLKSRPS